MSITTEQITANGLEFTYRSVGEGPLALCLHGFPDSARTWDHLLPALADAGYRAVAPFLRGYAPTAIPEDGMYQMGAVATDANALHEVLGGNGDAVLIGHDWGALASYAAANHQPERWRKVVTASVPPPATMTQGFFTYDQLRMSWYMFFFGSALADLVVPLNDLNFIDRLWQDWSPGFDGRDYAEYAKQCMREPERLAAVIGYYRAALHGGPRSPEYDAVEASMGQPLAQPHLYLHGVTDGCMGVGIIADHLRFETGSSGRIEIVADAGHFLQLEQPSVVNQLILDFLAE
jgi:pimeloyl-ACP methyl ester carboxylesterase